ncbi:unnamed protein product, partial [Strongylus vulgaris]
QVVCTVSAGFHGLAQNIYLNGAAVINAVILVFYALFLQKVRRMSITDKNLKSIYRSLIVISLSVLLGSIATIVIGFMFNLVRTNLSGMEMSMIAGLPINLAMAGNFFVYYVVSEQYRDLFDQYLHLDILRKYFGSRKLQSRVFTIA